MIIKMEKEKIVAYHALNAWGGIVILGIKYGIDDKVLTAFHFGEGLENKSWCKVYYTESGEPYFKKFGIRYYLHDFMTTDY